MLAAITGILSANHAPPALLCDPDIYYYGPVEDPYFDNVSLLLHFDGVNNGTVFTDSSKYALPVTISSGSPRTSTDQLKFGDTTGKFINGTDGLSTPHAADLSFGSTPFTIEFWIYLVSNYTFGRPILYKRTAGFYEYRVTINGSGGIEMIGTDGATQFFGLQTGNLTLGQWNHVALVWDGAAAGGAARSYVNGVLSGSGGGSGTFNTGLPAALDIGYTSALVNQCNYYLDDLRITKGISRYVGNFILPTSAYPNAEQNYVPGALDDFTTGLTPYTVTSGNGGLFSVSAGTYGQTLNIASQQSGTAANIRRPFSATNIQWASFYVYISTLNADDGPGISFSDNVTNDTLWNFNPCRESAFDALRRPVFTWRNTTSASFNTYTVGTAALTTGRWYQVKILVMPVPGATTTTNSALTLQIIDTTTQSVATYSVSGSSALPIKSTYLNFGVDSGLLTSACSYADIRIGSIPGHTSLLLHFDSMVDSSSEPKALSVVGGGITTVEKKFGTGSLGLSGTTQYVKPSVYQDFYFGTAPYTIETWVYPTVLLGRTRPIFTVTENLTGNFAFMGLQVAQDGRLQAVLSPNTGGAGAVAMTSSLTAPTIQINQWTHVAYTRAGNTACIFINGVLAATSTAWTNYPSAKVQNIAVGAYANGYVDGALGMWAGYIDELRITTGVARYTVDFTPPTSAFGNNVSTDPYFNNVILLSHADGPNGSTTLVDSSNYNRTANLTGAVALSSAVVKYGTASLNPWNTAFGAYSVSWVTSTDFNISTIDFTIEMWAYEQPGSFGSLICRRPGGQALGWALTTAGLRANINGVWSDSQMSWTRPPFNSWHHYAWVRAGSLMYMFVDGIMVATTTATSISDLSESVFIGQADNVSENKFLGFIDEIRWTRGVARYLQDFTPQTVPFCNGLV